MKACKTCGNPTPVYLAHVPGLCCDKCHASQPVFSKLDPVRDAGYTEPGTNAVGLNTLGAYLISNVSHETQGEKE